MNEVLRFLNTDHNRAELCEAQRKMTVIFTYLHRYQGFLTVALMLTVCALPSLAQLPSNQPDLFSSTSSPDQTATSWGDSIVNFFFFALPIGAIICLGLMIVGVIRKQAWSHWAIGLFLCCGGWAFVGALATSMAKGKTIKPTGLGR